MSAAPFSYLLAAEEISTAFVFSEIQKKNRMLHTLVGSMGSLGFEIFVEAQPSDTPTAHL